MSEAAGQPCDRRPLAMDVTISGKHRAILRFRTPQKQPRQADSGCITEHSPRRTVLLPAGGWILFGSAVPSFRIERTGKSDALNELRKRAIAYLAVHDFDEIGVPSGADTAWRHSANESWLRRGLDYQAEGVDLLLAGQSPLGEILAAQSAPQLEAISACLIDCSDKVRVARLRARGRDWFERIGGSMEDYLRWADWMRRHASDPTWMPEVIRASDPPQKCNGTAGAVGRQAIRDGVSRRSIRQHCQSSA
jgi:hypothetical protein